MPPTHMSSTPPAPPRVGIGVFVFNSSSSSFLMGRRKGSVGSGTWALPGGHLEFGESFEECAAREVLEETDLQIVDVRFWTAVNNVMMDVGKHYITIFMVAKVKEDGSDAAAVARNMEPDKCEGWEWVAWETMKTWATNAGGHMKEDAAMQEEDQGRRALFSPLLSLLRQRPNMSPVDA